MDDVGIGEPLAGIEGGVAPGVGDGLEHDASHRGVSDAVAHDGTELVGVDLGLDGGDE